VIPLALSIFVLYFIVALCISVINLFVERKRLTRERTLEIILLWFLVIAVGIAGMIGFIMHYFFADEMARGIGFPIGNPFQREVAFANLAFGILGILSIKYRGGFWLATIISSSVFLLGAAYGHVLEMSSGNYAANNAGMVLYTDIALPIILIGVWIALQMTQNDHGVK
jgi:hypothetical protein